MARKTETRKLQEYADEIWGNRRMEVRHIPFKGFEMIDSADVRLGRMLGRNATEAHAELDTMADLAESARVRKLAQI